MCGIVGYIGKRDTAPLLLEGLQRLEYRGYDSAGIAIHSGSGSGKPAGLKTAKTKGRVRDLEERIPKRFAGTAGIAHTRWATHGVPNDVNAHPHLDPDEQVAVVHNGIIDNAAELRAKLTADGVTFVSDTDTEVLAHLIARAQSRAPGSRVSRRRCATSRAPTASPYCTPTSPTASWWPATAPPSSWASARTRCSSPPTSRPWSRTPGRSSPWTTARWPPSRPATTARTPPRARAPPPPRTPWSTPPSPTTWAATTPTCTRRSPSRPTRWTGYCAAGSTTASRRCTWAASTSTRVTRAPCAASRSSAAAPPTTRA